MRNPQNEIINGTWSASGNQVRMATNTLQWQGTIQGNQIRGTGRVTNGSHTWTFTLTPGGSGGSSGNPASSSLVNTTWAATDSDNDEYTFTFLNGGALRYTFRGETRTDGTWSQSGNNVTINMGVLGGLRLTGTVSGNQMQGSGVMSGGHRWTWRGTRISGGNRTI